MGAGRGCHTLLELIQSFMLAWVGHSHVLGVTGSTMPVQDGTIE